MTLKTLAAAACISFAGASTAAALPVDFDFSYTSSKGLITGTIFGLNTDLVGSQPASAITVNGFLDTYTFQADDLNSNAFTVSSGPASIDRVAASLNALFLSGASGNFQADFALFSTGSIGLFECFDTLSCALVRSDPLNSVLFSDSGFVATPLTPVPLPAGGLLLISGLAGVAALKRRKRRAA